MRLVFHDPASDVLLLEVSGTCCVGPAKLAMLCPCTLPSTGKPTVAATSHL